MDIKVNEVNDFINELILSMNPLTFFGGTS